MVSIPQTTKYSKINLEEHLNTTGTGSTGTGTGTGSGSGSGSGRNNNSITNSLQANTTHNHKYTQRIIEQTEREQQINRDASRSNSSGLSALKTQIPTYYMSGLEKHHKVEDRNDYFCKLYREHFIQSVQGMQFCRNLRPVDQNELTKKKVYLTKRESHKGNDNHLCSFIDNILLF